MAFSSGVNLQIKGVTYTIKFLLQYILCSVHSIVLYCIVLYIVTVSHCNLREHYLLGSNLSGSLHSSGLLCSVEDENSKYIPFFMEGSPTAQSSVHTRVDLNQWKNNIHISTFKTNLKAVRIIPVRSGQ